MRGGVEDLIDLPAYTVLSYDDGFIEANNRWIESYHKLIEHLRKDLLQFRSDAKPQGIFNSTLKGDENTLLAIGSLRNMIVVAPNVELMNELLIRFCWQEIDPQLRSASKMITVDLIKQVYENVERHFAHFDDDELQRAYKQQLREAIHERFMRLGSWFRQPEDGFVSATTRQLGELILIEARDNNYLDNRTVEWSGDALDMEIDGLSVHRMYDCLFVTLRNALNYGASDGPILIGVRQEHAFESVSKIRTEVSSQFGEANERAGHIARLADSFASGDPEAAMAIEGYSGIRKLRYITRSSEGATTAEYKVDDDMCTVSFSLTVELAHRERSQ